MDLKVLEEKAKSLCKYLLPLGEAWVRVLTPSLFPHLRRHSPHLYFLPKVYPAVSNKFNYNSLRASNYLKNDLIKPSALYLNPCNIISGSVVI